MFFARPGGSVGLERKEAVMIVMTKNFENPDEHRTLPNGSMKGDIVHVGDMIVGRGEIKPGWRWSNDVRPIAGTLSCEYEHRGVAVAGVLHVEMDDGSGVDIGPGDVYLIPPGHDAWVVGNDSFRSIDWSRGIDTFGKPKD